MIRSHLCQKAKNIYEIRNIFSRKRFYFNVLGWIYLFLALISKIFYAILQVSSAENGFGKMYEVPAKILSWDLMQAN